MPDQWTERFAAFCAVVVGLACAAPSQQVSTPVAGAVAAPAYAQLTALPGAITVAVGDTVRLHALALDHNLDTIGRPDVQWHSANPRIAEVTPRGFVTAYAPGLAGITATGGGRVASARVSVVPSGSEVSRNQAPSSRAASDPERAFEPPKPARRAQGGRSSDQRAPMVAVEPPSETDRPHEPPGLTPITNRNFQSKARNRDDRGPNGSEGWTGTEARYERFTIERDPTAPTGDSLVGQMFYGPHHRAGTGPATSNIYLPEGIAEAYVSVWAQISPNWVGNQSSTNKMFFMGISGGNNQFFFSAEGSGRRRLEAQLRLQGIGDARGRIRPNVRAAEVVRGTWQHWEFLLRCNSARNAPDGSIDLWIDGAHVTAARDVNWTQTKHPERPCAINMFHWNPTYGGGGASPGVPQWIRFDRVYISGR